jgi:hypothetical protein
MVDPSGADLHEGFHRSDYEMQAYGHDPAYGYATQPNHGINLAHDRLWATNLLFGAPLEVDIATWQPTRIVRHVEPHPDAPRVSTTAHFAWSTGGARAYFHQSLLRRERNGAPVGACELKLVRLDLEAGTERHWDLLPPAGDGDLAAANFHSAFWWREHGVEHVGLLRTGAVLETLAPHPTPSEHRVLRSPTAAIWDISIDDRAGQLQAALLPGLEGFTGIAMSHLAAQPNEDGFILFANCKQADVGEETHGENIYGQPPAALTEHYSGMITEPFNFGSVLRYARTSEGYQIKIFERPYDARYASEGHTWMPINIEADPSGETVYCSFAGFRPRLLSRHIAAAYVDLGIDPGKVRYVPPLIMRLDSKSLLPQRVPRRGHLAYAEPIAMSLIGDCETGYLCTFSPEQGFRVLQAADLNEVVGYAVNHDLWHWNDTHFRPDPPHMVHVPH